MNLYHWNVSEALKNYAPGDIIVMAESVEKARIKARVQIEIFLTLAREWWYSAHGQLDPDSREDHSEFLRKFEQDIAHEPDLVESGAIFITGSE